MDKSQIQVLLLEDNLTDAIFLREALREDALTAFEVTVVERLQTAVEILHNTLFDIILLDLGLPDSQGLETFRRLHQLVPQIPKVILSGLSDETVAMEAVHAGAQDYLVKGAPGFASAARAIRYAIERQQTQQALRASEERFRALIENGSDDISLLDVEGNLLWESPAVVRNLGYPENAFVGHNILELVHPEDKPWVEALQTRLIQLPGGRENGIVRLQHIDGSWRWVEAVVTNMLNNPSVEAVVVNYHDITERKQADEKARSANEFLQGVQNALSAHIAILDRDGIIVQVNEAWRRFADQNGLIHPNHGVGLNYLEICDSVTGPDAVEAPLVANAIREILSGKLEQAQIEYPCHSPTEQRWFLLQITGFKDGEKIFVVLAHENITERKQIEETLKETSEQFRTLFEASPEAIVIIDPHKNWTIMDCNTTCCAMNGYSRKELIGQPVNILNTKQDTPAEQAEHLERVRKVGVLRLEASHRHKNGTVFPIEISTSVITLNGREMVLGIDRDITERKRAEQALRESEALYRKAMEVAGAVPYRESYSGNERSIQYEFIGEGIQQITGYGPEEFNVKLWDSLTEEANLVEDLKGYTIDEGIRRVRSGENPIWKCEYRIQDRAGATHWVLEAALEVRDEHGVSHGSIGTYQDITARKQAEIQIHELLEFNEKILNNSPVGILSYKLTGECVFANQTAATITGMDVKHLKAQNYHEIDSWKNSGLYDFVERVVNSGQTAISDFHILTTGAKDVWITVHCARFRSNEEDNVLLMYSDITERKQTEEKLRESETRFASIFHTNPTRVSITSYADGRYLDVNESFLTSSGYSREEVIGHSTLEFDDWVHTQDRLVLRTLLAEQGSVANFETQLRQKSGRILDMLLSAEVVELFGQRCILSVGLDITSRKQTEQKLLEANERFQQLANNIQEVFWINDALTGADLYISPACEKIWGRSIEDIMQDPNLFLNAVIPEDRQALLDTMERQKGGARTEIEYRIVKPDGSIRWVWDRAFPIFDADGRVVRLAGIAADITERKQAEKNLTRHLAELQALYINGLAVGQLLEPGEIGERVIATFAKYLAWHHVAIRLRESEGDELRLVAFNYGERSGLDKAAAALHLDAKVSRVGQGLSGWVVETGEAFRTSNINAQPHYVHTFPGIQSGLYMPLKIGENCIGVISVESEEPDAFTEQDERLLATLANQAAIAFENARLYQAVQQELYERKRIETELRISETHYRELADSITDVFFELDHDLRYSYWNKASELLSGVAAYAAIGKSMREIFGDSEEQDRIEKIYKSVLEQHKPRTFETPFLVNEQIRSFEVNAYPSTYGVSVVAKDVTARKHSETIMQKRFELMEFSADHTLEELMQKTTNEVCDLTESSIGFFHLMDADQVTPTLLILPQTTLDLFNVPASEGHHRAVEQAGVWAEAIRQRRPIIHNDYESLPNKKTLPDGHAPIVCEMVIPIIRNEKILAVLGVGNKSKNYTQQDLDIAERIADYAWDITERKQMELALGEERNQLALRVEERTLDLSRANANLARALRVKDEFLANMSHELRTPLNAILGLSESLAEQTAGPLNEKQMRYITTVSESGHHLLSLINDILDLAKIEAGQITLDVHKVDINSVCEASLRMVKQLARKKNQDAQIKIDQSLGLMWADERRLKQMLVNLLSNAVKFTPEGGKLGLEVHGDQEQNKVTFTIWDTGIGIEESDLPRLFQPFVQLDAGLARESSGTGLGLALVAQMARLHGGSVSVASRPGEGSRFSIVLPWEPTLTSDTIERLKSTGKFRPIKFSQERKPIVLLIEDTEDVIMMISDYLTLNGYKVITARDGVEGVTQAQLTHPDLILMDIQMPRMDGFETTKKLRAEADFKNTPIIALTALAMPNDRERCLAVGMDEYITKPVHLRALIKIIETFLSGELEQKPK